MAEQPNLDQIDRTIRYIEIALTIGRHILHIMWLFFGITVAFAVFDFATGNIVWGIVGTIFAVGGLIFIIQIYQTRSRHRQRARQVRARQVKVEHSEAAASA
jgi:hypothetical protein